MVLSLIPITSVFRLLLLTACFSVSMTFAGCGSRNGPIVTPSSPSPPSPVELPLPIPAAQPILLFNGTGTSSTDVSAVEAILAGLGVGYELADSAQLNAMTEPRLAGYKLLIIPGGNSISIGQNLTAATATAIRGAVQDYGVHYLGICAGAFFGGFSDYNGADLTAGVSFDFYTDEF